MFVDIYMTEKNWQEKFVEFHTSKKCWPTCVGQKLVCVNDTTTIWERAGERRDEFYLSPTVCQHIVESFKHTNLSLLFELANIFLSCEGERIKKRIDRALHVEQRLANGID